MSDGLVLQDYGYILSSRRAVSDWSYFDLDIISFTLIRPMYVVPYYVLRMCPHFAGA